MAGGGEGGGEGGGGEGGGGGGRGTEEKEGEERVSYALGDFRETLPVLLSRYDPGEVLVVACGAARQQLASATATATATASQATRAAS